MSEYITKQGDTFSSISRSEAGSERYAQLIKQANPHATTPFKIGTVINLPFGGKTSTKNFKPFGLDIKMDGISVAAYDQFTYSGAIDSFSKNKFTIPNDIETRAIAPLLTPISLDIGYNGEQMFSGYMDTPRPASSASGKTLEISALSWPNLLSSAPSMTCFPMEFKKTGLSTVAKTLIEPFGIEHVFQSDQGPIFTKLQIKQDDDVLSILAKLCKQRALVMRDDADGTVVFDNGTIMGAPVLRIDDYKRPDVSIVANINPTQWYSHVTAILKSKRSRNKKRLTWVNPFYNGIMKNHNFEIAESDDGEMATAVYSVAARMFASVFSLQITVPGWLDKNGELLKSGNSIVVKSETNYINDFTEFLISGVTNSGTPDDKTSVLECVIPGCYAGIIPEVVPWKLA